ncbi:5'-methylthioadenosine/S-adenosylhomocysteine nucleosidase [Actinotalea sp. BY-33]|uniref:adenosylhomocysteine nucleosidase n=1 Tax=Actinotalea soli TaxID=2819234 RepID=A0A939LPZ3_9CELL|nr:5'-methylthioadenosine/S-adenosylhomocysteine nucleosidase [Actinotalea soli]MBO1751843.1 5'-methylthioadenosine/S-adenosylhomocysteine nucleosidase [Actinotalea soli]
MISVDAIVVVAMADEAAPFLERAQAVGSATQVGRAEHRVVSVEGRSVLLVRSGIGLVSAAAAAAVAIGGTRPRALISAGSAGGIGAEVRVGDVVVGSEYVYSGADARAFGYALGQVPGMPPTYAPGQALLGAVPTPGPEGLRVLTGAMLSGDSFIDAAMVDGVRTAFPSGLSTDMESVALAQTCHLYDVPFLAVRGISDLCGPVAGEDFLTHVDDAADRSAAVVLSVLTAVS